MYRPIYQVFILFFFISLFISNKIFSQTSYSIDSLSRIPIVEQTSSVWGLTHSNGKEIGLLGSRLGLRIYDLSDPMNPSEIFFIPGSSCIWRELKTNHNYVYVVTECGDGLLIVDLNDLSNIKYHYVNNYLDLSGNEHQITTSHTLFIDEKDYLYFSGANGNNSGFAILDIKTDPYQPIFINSYNDEYYHEVFVHDDTLYAAGLFIGQFVIWDIHDRLNPKIIGNNETPFHFTHSVWKEDDRNILYTTDERESAFLSVFDISNPNRIRHLNDFRPNVPDDVLSIPHNCFYKDGFVFLSWYTEGVRVVDVRKPDNLVEVAFYDTYPQNGTGFHGCWNVYPYFKSGIILASDIENGLYVLRFHPNKAAYLEGKITDVESGIDLNNVKISIRGLDNKTQVNTNLLGEYKTGIDRNARVQIKLELPGYEILTDSIDLFQDSTIIKNYQLKKLVKFRVSLNIRANENNQALENVKFRFWNNGLNFESQTDNLGHSEIDIVKGNYLFQTALWGRLHYTIPQFICENDTSINLLLDLGYEDQFNISEYWGFSPDSQKIAWKYGNFSELNPPPSNYPSKDITYDYGDQALYTNNYSDSDQSLNVVGHSYLTSEVMDLSLYDEIDLEYSAWAYGGWDGSIKETYLLLNGQKLPLEQIEENLSGHFNAKSTFHIDLRNKLRDEAIFVFHQWNNPDSVNLAITMKAALDAFKLTGKLTTSAKEELTIKLKIFPNPMRDYFMVNNTNTSDVESKIYNTTGQLCLDKSIHSNTTLKLDSRNWPEGFYFCKYKANNESNWKYFKLLKN